MGATVILAFRHFVQGQEEEAVVGPRQERVELAETGALWVEVAEGEELH
jgi:hypothetical protein